ncbi:MAG: ATP/GTP-binding protein [Oscillospiraceae bacterium]|nr:ATP/GTP-binding protein [Oscillospiraceae bacterium]
MKKITVIAGHYGSGKSTFAANYAIQQAAMGENVTVVDMDTVNPYYRTADLEDIFTENGVKLAAPRYAGTNLDVPILDFDIPALFSEGRNLVIDLGGDDAGAFPLGKFREFIKAHSDDAEILYVVNFCRFLTHEPNEAAEILREIEAACGLAATGIVNNSNLGFETDSEIIENGRHKAEKISVLTGLPVFCHTLPLIPSCEEIDRAGFFPLTVYIKNVWN